MINLMIQIKDMECHILLPDASIGNNLSTDADESSTCFPLPVFDLCVQSQVVATPGSASVPEVAGPDPMPNPPPRSTTTPARALPSTTSSTTPVVHEAPPATSHADPVLRPTSATTTSSVPRPELHTTLSGSPGTPPTTASAVVPHLTSGTSSSTGAARLPLASDARTTAAPPQVLPHRTRHQGGIQKPKQYNNVTVRYGHLAVSSEPLNLHEALSTPHWKSAMHDEYAALLRNKTWHLVLLNQAAIL
jgi:hypothetical protein